MVKMKKEDIRLHILGNQVSFIFYNAFFPLFFNFIFSNFFSHINNIQIIIFLYKDNYK